MLYRVQFFFFLGNAIAVPYSTWLCSIDINYLSTKAFFLYFAYVKMHILVWRLVKHPPPPKQYMFSESKYSGEYNNGSCNF